MEKLPNVTKEKWDEVCDFNKQLTEEFLEQQQLSPDTIKQYRSGLYQFFWWVKEKNQNTPIVELKARDALRYQNYLIERGLSSSAVKLKRSVVSSLCGYIEVFYENEYPLFRNIFNKKIPSIARNFKHEKEPLTLDEYDLLKKELQRKGLWQHLAYVIVSFETGARRSEIAQLKKEVVDYDWIDGKKYIMSHTLRGKGKGKEGKKIKVVLGEDSINAIKKWLDVRGEDDCEYVFVRKHKGASEAIQIYRETFNYWCSEIFTDIVGRRMYPHNFRSARATALANSDVPIASIQKLLNHDSPETTNGYILVNEDEKLDAIF